MSWEEALRYASGDGVAAIVAAVLSVLAEYWPWYGEQGPKVKQAVFFALALVVPLVAAGLGVATVDWSLSWDVTFWPALRAGLAAVAVGTGVHWVHSRIKG
jgi:ABC-type spermidine/putrescine transport system permease subunit II